VSPARNRRRLAIVLATAGLLSIATIALADHGFTDVPHGSTHEPGIEYVADAGITQGCTADEYCPDDPLTRAQMGTFLFRASGHDPATPPSVNAATLAGEGASAYTTTVTSVGLESNVGLSGATSNATAADVLDLELPAGEYVITGQVTFNAQTTDQARVICRVLVDGSTVSQTINRLGSTAGNQSQASTPVSAHVEIASGSADVELVCHAESLAGSAPSVSSPGSRTHIIATRVGDAS